MKIHEFQAKQLLRDAGIAVPNGVVSRSGDDAAAAFNQLGGKLAVVKAQIHAGGRGKGKFKELGPDAKGGVRLAKTADEVRAAATDMLGNTLVTIGSTKPAGEGNKSERAGQVGEAIAQACIGKGIKTVVFDRNGYIYHGRVKALTEAAREAGLNKNEQTEQTVEKTEE